MCMICRNPAHRLMPGEVFSLGLNGDDPDKSLQSAVSGAYAGSKKGGDDPTTEELKAQGRSSLASLVKQFLLGNGPSDSGKTSQHSTGIDGGSSPRPYRLGARANFNPDVRKIPTGPATIVIQNANVFTGVRGQEHQQAVAIQGDLILAVGTNEEIAKHINEKTRVIDAKGRTVTPGFIETHGHLPDIVERAIGRVDSMEEISQMPPIDGWIRIVGADPGSLKNFDALTGDTPAYWESHAGSGSRVNSAALKLAREYWAKQPTFYGMPNPTFGDPTRLPEPPGGHVTERDGSLHYANNLFFDGRDQDGKLPSYEELGGVMPQMPYEILKEPLRRTMAYFAANGITGFHDMMGSPQDLTSLGKLEKDGHLTARVYKVQGMGQHKLHTQVTDQFLALMDEITQRYNSERLWTGMVKFNDSGTSVAELAEEVRRLNQAGLQAAVHTFGDKLQSFVRAEKEAPGSASRLRHRLEHTMGDIGLADELGTGGTFQFSLPPASITKLPNARQHFGIGTDWDVKTNLDPMEMLGPTAQRLGSVDEALHAYTSNAAWLGHAENMVGSLEPGKKADIVMLSNDILDKPSNISKARTALTVFDGEVIFEAAGPNGDPKAASYDNWLRDVQRLGLEAAAKLQAP